MHLSAIKTLSCALVIRDVIIYCHCHCYDFCSRISGIIVLCSDQTFINISHEKIVIKIKIAIFIEKSNGNRLKLNQWESWPHYYSTILIYFLRAIDSQCFDEYHTVHIDCYRHLNVFCLNLKFSNEWRLNLSEHISTRDRNTCFKSLTVLYFWKFNISFSHSDQLSCTCNSDKKFINKLLCIIFISIQTSDFYIFRVFLLW